MQWLLIACLVLSFMILAGGLSATTKEVDLLRKELVDLKQATKMGFLIMDKKIGRHSK